MYIYIYIYTFLIKKISLCVDLADTKNFDFCLCWF